MTPAPKPFHEPEENEFIRRDEPTLDRGSGLYEGLLKGLLDQIEASVNQAIEHGLEGELRRRLAYQLPPLPASASQPIAPAPGIGGRLSGLSADQVNTLLGFHNCVQAFDDQVQRSKEGSTTAKRAASCRDFLRAHIEKLKSGRDA